MTRAWVKRLVISLCVQEKMKLVSQLKSLLLMFCVFNDSSTPFDFMAATLARL